MNFKISKLVGLLTLAALCSYSSAILAAICTAPGAGNWSAPATWGAGGGCLGVPLAADTVILNGAVLLDTATAVAFGVTVNAALTFGPGGFLTVGSGGHGTGFLSTAAVTVTGGSGISIDTHLDNVVAFSNTAAFTLGAPATLYVSGFDGKGITNSGTFTGGSGAISTNSFTNTAGTFVLNGPMSISFLNSVASSLFTNTAGTVTLNGNISIAGSINTGAGTFAAGAGKMIFTGDRNHTITGPVAVHNLEIATLTGARTISISGSVAETGITVLNGASAVNSITFAGSSSPIITAFTSSNCAGAGGVLNITCNITIPTPPTSAAISLISYENAPVFSRELSLK